MPQTIKLKIRLDISPLRHSDVKDSICRLARLAGTGLGGIDCKVGLPLLPRSTSSFKVVARGESSAINQLVRMLREAYPSGEIT